MRLLKVNKAGLAHLLLVVAYIEMINHFNVTSKGDTGNPKFENKFTGW